MLQPARPIRTARPPTNARRGGVMARPAVAANAAPSAGGFRCHEVAGSGAGSRHLWKTGCGCEPWAWRSRVGGVMAADPSSWHPDIKGGALGARQTGGADFESVSGSHLIDAQVAEPGDAVHRRDLFRSRQGGGAEGAAVFADRDRDDVGEGRDRIVLVV